MQRIGGSGRVLIALAFTVSLIAAACTSEGSSTVPTVRASLTPSASPSATAPPLVQEGGAPLGPGTYTTVFQPTITFTTDASWVSYADTSDFVEFERPGGTGGGIQFKRIDRVLDPMRAQRLLPVPKDYVGWIVTLPGVKVLAGPKAVTVDGVKGTEIDVQAAKDAPTVYCKDPCVELWLLRHPDYPGEGAVLTPDSVSRIVALRLHGETVEISACSCDLGVAGFPALAKDFDSMIATVHFG